jgi:hypothetical protein
MKYSIKVLHEDNIQTVEGRRAWALERLITAGSAGCTPLDHPAPRWAAYVHRLRQEGFSIETITEAHGGAYAGHHARYVLRTPVSVIGMCEAA